MAAATHSPSVEPGRGKGANMPIGFASLWRAVKRYSLLMFVFTLLAASAGVLVYFFLPLPKMTGRIIYLVNTNQAGHLSPTVWNERDPANFRAFQVNTLTGRLVLNAALSEPGVASAPMLTKDPSIDGVQFLQSNMKVDFSTGAEHMRVTLEGDSADELLMILKAVNSAYMKEVSQKEMMRRRAKMETLNHLLTAQNERIKKLSGQIRAIITTGSTSEIQLEFQQRHYQNEMNAADSELSVLDRRKRELTLMLKTLEAEFKLPPNLRRPVDKEMVQPFVDNDPRVIAQVRKVNELTARMKAYDNLLKPGNPEPPTLAQARAEKTQAEAELKKMQLELFAGYRDQLKKELEKNEQQALENFKKQLDLIHDQQTEVMTQLKTVVGKLNELNGTMAATEGLQLEKKNAESIASRVNSELVTMETEMDVPTRVSMWEDAYVFPGIEGNRRVKYTVMAVAGFLILGLALAQWLEIRHRRIQSIDEITSGLGLQVLGTVPAMPKGGTAARSNWPHLLTEAVNTTRTMLLSGPGSAETRTLLVTSAMSGEGKTSLTTHLAVSLASAGRRVLLIDADMRRPAVHKVLGLESKPGLAEVLVGTANMADVCQACKVPGLHLLPAGTYSREAAAMLSTDRWQNILKEGSIGYDFVLVDSPPILPVADALALARNVDGVLISVMQDLSRYGAVQTACQRLTMVGAKVLGVVVSGVTSQGGYYYYYYYDERYSKPKANSEPIAPVEAAETPKPE